MLHLCRFVPGLPYRVKLDPGGSVSLIAENGTDILFYAQYRPDPGHVVLNSATDRQWGAEEHLPRALPEQAAEAEAGADGRPAPCEIVLRLAGPVLEVELDGKPHVFSRFTQAQAGAVAFVRLHWARDPEAALIWRGETLEVALTGIEAHLLHRRMDDLERRMGQGAGDER